MVSVTPVILCGGSGTRLWPLSTPERPKQFLALTADQPMIAETADRFKASHVEGLNFSKVAVVGSQKHERLLSEALPDAQFILEPFGRNSAPAVAAVCLISDPDDLLLILPADHSITNVPAFHDAIQVGIDSALAGNILTFGLEPSFAATGYGYIHSVASEGRVKNVSEFVEKPAAEVAERYLAEGNYFWNAGIFLFKASSMLEAFKAHAADVLPPVRAALAKADGKIVYLSPEHFSKAPDISIDYAIMEHANNVKVVPVEMGWSDVGDYQALHELYSQNGNSVVTQGPAFVEASENVYVNSQGPVIAASGLKDLTVVATNDTVMITPAGDSAAIKALGKYVQSNRTRLGLNDRFVSDVRDWLWSTFDYWADKVWDEAAGGFVEQLSFEGLPDYESPRRVRVQARQVFSFARALQYGWKNKDHAERMVSLGLDYLDQKLRHPDGGWVHVVDRNADPIDTKRDLYDHAFVILAGAAAYEATQSKLALKIAYEALDFVNTAIKAPNAQGWYEGIPASLPRRANPHMHMLEACSALYRATNNPIALQTAKECVTLFETRFFDASVDIMGEFFGQDWSPIAPSQETVFETGHMYEWATLLHEFDRLADHDSLSWRRRMIRCADAQVRAHKDGFAINAQRLDGQTVNAGRRLWPQLEMLRAHTLHPGMAPIGTVERLYLAIKSEYIDPAPKGLWIDEFDSNGRPASKAVPSSILYHFVTAYSPLL